MGSPRKHSRLRILDHLPATQPELVNKLCTVPSVVHRYLKQMEDDGQAHIGGWHIHATNKRRIGIWHAGPGTTPNQPATKGASHHRKSSRQPRHVPQGIQHHPLHAAFFGLGT